MHNHILMEADSPKLDYMLEEVLQVRDQLIYKTFEENKDRFSSTSVLCIITYKGMFNRALR